MENLDRFSTKGGEFTKTGEQIGRGFGWSLLKKRVSDNQIYPV